MDLQREAEGRQLITSRQAARSESLFSTGSHGDVNAPWSPSLSLSSGPAGSGVWTRREWTLGRLVQLCCMAQKACCMWIMVHP